MKKYRGIMIVALFLCVGLSVAQAAKAAEYEYDRLNRVTKVTYEDGSYVTYQYDANGNITEIHSYTSDGSEGEIITPSPTPGGSEGGNATPSPTPGGSEGGNVTPGRTIYPDNMIEAVKIGLEKLLGQMPVFRLGLPQNLPEQIRGRITLAMELRRQGEELTRKTGLAVSRRIMNLLSGN